MKEVQIYPKTSIEVPDAISDEQARKEYFKKRKHSDNVIGPMARDPEMYKKKVKHKGSLNPR